MRTKTDNAPGQRRVRSTVMADAVPPVVSVVIPTHNRRELLLRAVASVLDQDTAARVEIVVVDDA